MEPGAIQSEGSTFAKTPKMPSGSRAEFAHYYGDWFWPEERIAWVKSLLLFFDGIALAMPRATAALFIDSDPVLAQPLTELGLLRNYPPNLWLKSPFKEDRSVLGRFFATQTELGTCSCGDLGHVDALSAPRSIRELAHDRSKKEFRKTVEGFNRSLDRTMRQYGSSPALARALTVNVTSRFLQQYVTDVWIQPVIDDDDAASFVASAMGEQNTSRARIILNDLLHLDLDLSAVPLDEVLDFRRQYAAEYRSYSHQVRQFALELSLLPESDQSFALEDRRTELDSRARQLRKIGHSAFAHRTLSMGFGFAGAAWTLAHGDVWAAAFAAGAIAAGISKPDPEPIGAAYTYILRMQNSLKR